MTHLLQDCAKRCSFSKVLGQPPAALLKLSSCKSVKHDSFGIFLRFLHVNKRFHRYFKSNEFLLKVSHVHIICKIIKPARH